MDSVRLIAALGNPGPQYEDTRHNLGFMLADRLIALGRERKSMRLERLDGSDDCETFRLHLGGAPRILVKPLAYMNLSGDAVARVAGRESIRAEEILVVHDDLDLDLGRIKLKQGGGSGGHKGVESIAERLGSTAFWRLRLGIGRPPQFTPVERYVLEPPTREEAPLLPGILDEALKGLEVFFRRGPQAAMTHLHTAQEQSEAGNGPDGRAEDRGEQGRTRETKEPGASS